MAKARRQQAVGSDAGLGERRYHRLGPGGTKLLVMSSRTYIIGVALHRQAQAEVLLQQLKHLGQRGLGIGPQGGLVGIKIEIQRYVALRC